MVTVTVYIVIAAVSILIYFYLFKKKGNFPPGPIGFPFVGNAVQMGMRPYLALTKWAKIYGNIYTVRFGPNKAVVINGHELMKEVFNDPAFSGRPQEEIFMIITKGPYGVINTEKETWESQRRFTLRHLRDFGFGKSSLESLIMDEAKELIEKFKKEEGLPTTVNRAFSLAVVNSLWTIVTGKRNSQDDPVLISLLDSLHTLGEQMTEAGILVMVPWLMKMAPELSKYNAFVRVADKFGKFVKESMSFHKETLPEEGSPRDFVDAYYHEIQKTKDSTSSFYGDTGEKNLYALLTDLFQAGAETSSATLAWTMLYLGGHQDIQKKLQNEIDQVVGKSRLPSLTDRIIMPYTEAVIMEVMRLSTIVPMGVFHKAIETKEVKGYLIEKGDWMVMNVWESHFNKEIWGDPLNFRPERFLSEDEKTVKKNDALIPFLVGSRRCLGESLAKDTLFIFITSIFQRFNVKLHLPNGGKPDYEADLAFLRNPKKFHVILEDRL